MGAAGATGARVLHWCFLPGPWHGLPGWLWACTTTAGLLSKSLAASMLPVNCYDLGCSRVLVGAPGYSQLCQLHPPDHPGEASAEDSG